jgi:hypothetical protein
MTCAGLNWVESNPVLPHVDVYQSGPMVEKSRLTLRPAALGIWRRTSKVPDLIFPPPKFLPAVTYCYLRACV